MEQFQIQELIKQNKHQEALEAIDQLLLSDNQNIQLLFWRSVSHLALEQIGLAKRDLELALNILPSDPDLISQMAVLHFHENDLVAAERLMNKAQNLDPKNPYRYSSRAYILERRGKLQEAIQDYEEAIRLDPEDAVAHNNLGMLQEKLGWKQKASRHFKKADLLSDGKVFQPKPAPEGSLESETQEKKQVQESNDSTDLRSRSAIIKKVFTNKEARSEFYEFIKSIFLKSAD